jgi:hypothetical protein
MTIAPELRAAHPDTRAVHAGRADLAGLGVHVPPIDFSTTNPLPDVELGGESYEAMATGGLPVDGGSHVYQRLWNPTTARFEQALAELEACEQAVHARRLARRGGHPDPAPCFAHPPAGGRRGQAAGRAAAPGGRSGGLH